MELGRFFGFLHPALVHFPLVLLVLSVGVEAVGFFWRERRATWAAPILLGIGMAFTLVAFVAGNFAELWAARQGVPQEPMEYHELLATLTSWSFVFLTAWRLSAGLEATRRGMAGYLALATLACILLGVTGHHGAMLVYKRGAAVQASGPPPVPSHEDLLQLTLRQGEDEIFYSNKMHHIFGWMTLILGLMLVVDALSAKAGERLRKVGPILLLFGGAYLMIFSDTDAWPIWYINRALHRPIPPFRPVLDKEVLMHKTYATLMLVVGLRGLWRRRGAAPPSRQLQNRTMAIFALVGGALLFTHVHSGAAYANVAVGVYVHHTVMGFVALAIGATKLLEDALPLRSPLRKFGFRWAYPALMILEAILLINYNEGLPWFIGYGEMRVNAPHNGLLAHFGPNRAELVFDRASGRLDVYVLGRNDDNPKPIAAATLQGIAKIGMATTLVPLDAAPEPGGNSHFVGTATFLRDAPLFEFQASAPRMTADFEPVVDTSKTLPHALNAAFVCPMHSEVSANTAETCRICGMALVPNKPPRPASQLHDDGYAMNMLVSEDVSREAENYRRWMTYPTPRSVERIAAGQPVLLEFGLYNAAGYLITDFATVHTKKLHLIIANRDLSFFDHVHPKLYPGPGGAFVLSYTFQQPGEYELYADLTPTGDRNQVFRLPVTVAGTPPAPKPLVITPTQAKLFGDYRVSLAISPEPLQSKDETYLMFTIQENGVPVTDIETFLGAGGHCVILSEDTQNYLHSHPTETSATRFGPSVTFHTVFPRPGKYKIWGQFQHKGKPLIADFVVEVQK